MKPKRAPFVVIVDSREQRPYAFDDIREQGRELMISTCRTGLTTGDYSIRGLENVIAIERKTKVDLYGTVGRGRARFKREIERLAAMTAPALVLECDLKSMLRRPRYSKMSPLSVLHSLISWSVRFRIPVWTCPGRRSAEIVTYRLLHHFWKSTKHRRS